MEETESKIVSRHAAQDERHQGQEGQVEPGR